MADASIDEMLIARAKEGDRLAFDSLIDRYQSFVYRTTSRMLSSDADDAAQLTFIRAFKGLASFRGESTFKTWLGTIAIRVCTNYRTQHSDRERRFESTDAAANTESDARLADSSRNPERAEGQRQLQAIVRECVGSLPEKYRAPVVLVDLEDMTYEDSASAIGIELNTLRIRLHRGRKRLRQMLEKRIGTGGEF